MRRVWLPIFPGAADVDRDFSAVSACGDRAGKKPVNEINGEMHVKYYGMPNGMRLLFRRSFREKTDGDPGYIMSEAAADSRGCTCPGPYRAPYGKKGVFGRI